MMGYWGDDDVSSQRNVEVAAAKPRHHRHDAGFLPVQRGSTSGVVRCWPMRGITMTDGLDEGPTEEDRRLAADHDDEGVDVALAIARAARGEPAGTPRPST
jgi:hypothetical protein